MLNVFLLVLITMMTSLHAESVKLKAIADVWLSDANDSERNSSSGKNARIKLKTIQEMGAFRFDVSAVKGKEVKSAKLFLKLSGKNMLRFLRVSTISQSWVEGTSKAAYGPANGATFNHADAGSKKSWSYPGSQFADVIMGSGNTITTYDQFQKVGKGWISVKLTPELIYAMSNGSTDGLCVMDGGNLAYFNNFISSREQNGGQPYIQVELGGSLSKAPAKPVVTAKENYERSGIKTGAIAVSIKSTTDVFSWNITLDGKAVERWKIPFPFVTQRTGLEQNHLSGRAPAPEKVSFLLDGLAPGKSYKLDVVAVSKGGGLSPKTSVNVKSSIARVGTPKAAAIKEPAGGSKPFSLGSKLKVWAVPGLVKVDPVSSKSIHGDLAGLGDGNSVNAVWNGKAITLHGAKGEFVSFQIVVARNNTSAPVQGITIAPSALKNGGSSIGIGDFELFKNWYSTPSIKSKRWYPAFNVPMKSRGSFAIPDAKRGMNEQKNQTILVDVYIPKTGKPGVHKGSISVKQGSSIIKLPIEVNVYNFALPDKLNFYVEFNTYSVPRKNHLDYHRVAHQNRCVFNPWRYRPKASGTGKALTLDWGSYDKKVGPLLSGEAFKNNRRNSVPVPCLYLPFEDTWPINLDKNNYHYKGPWVSFKGYGIKGNKNKNPAYKKAKDDLNKHYMISNYIGKALQPAYQDGEAKAIKLFVEHFKSKGWNQTEMHQFYGGKKTHRIDYATNMWWMTDEPYHWDDWQALQFFNNLWTKTIRSIGADQNIWMARGDISRPNWQGKVLDGVIQLQYGGFGTATRNKRMHWLRDNTGVKIRDYGGLGNTSMSYTQASSNIIHLWLSGAGGFLPWQTVGRAGSLDNNSTTSLFVEGSRFGISVVADMRLKGFREGQQLIEYLVILEKTKKLSKDQIRIYVNNFFSVGMKHTGGNVDNADSKKSTTFKAWQISELRKQLAKLISK